LSSTIGARDRARAEAKAETRTRAGTGTRTETRPRTENRTGLSLYACLAIVVHLACTRQPLT